jgi:hypothetical protein
VPDGAGGWNSYYYDGDDSVWKNSRAPYATIDPASVSLSSGLLFYNGGAGNNLTNLPPAPYSSL